MLAGCAVHGVESIWLVSASCGVWIEYNLRKTVGRAGSHRARLAGVQVVNHHLKTIWSVVQVHDQPVTRVHLQDFCGIRRVSGEGRIQRVGGSLRHTGEGDEREVHRLNADFAETVRIVGCPGVLIDRETVDVERSAVMGRIATVAGRPGNPSRRVELHLHECSAGVTPDVNGHRWVRVVKNVAVAVMRTSVRKFWFLLRYANCYDS